MVRERAAQREEEEAKHKRENPRKPFNLPAGQTITSLELTPDEKYVIAGVTEPATGAKKTIVPNFVTESGYTEDIVGRDNVGDIQSRTRLGLLSVETGEVKWVDAEQKEPSRRIDKLNSGHRCGRKTAPRPFCSLAPPTTRTAGFWRSIRPPAKPACLSHDHDDAWVDGPGANTLGWMKNDREVYFQSERTGYSHSMPSAFDGGEPRALTSGKWEVTESHDLSDDKSKFFLTTSKDDPGEQQVYEMSAEGGARTRLTAAPGGHAAVLSPDERWFADVYSYTNKPPELYVQETRAGAAARS